MNTAHAFYPWSRGNPALCATCNHGPGHELHKPATITARIEGNPGYDPDYPKDKFPFTVIVGRGLTMQWCFAATLDDAKARKALIDGKGAV